MGTEPVNAPVGWGTTSTDPTAAPVMSSSLDANSRTWISGGTLPLSRSRSRPQKLTVSVCR